MFFSFLWKLKQGALKQLTGGQAPNFSTRSGGFCDQNLSQTVPQLIPIGRYVAAVMRGVVKKHDSCMSFIAVVTFFGACTRWSKDADLALVLCLVIQSAGSHKI